MQTDLITKVYFNEHLTHSCVGMPQGLQALLSSFIREVVYPNSRYREFDHEVKWKVVSPDSR